MQPSHILCPVDLSELSAEALRYAAGLARGLGARLTVLYAETFSAPPYFTRSKLDELERQFRSSFQEAESALRAFVEKEVTGEAELLVVEGLPVDAIHKAARETKADLIVMGTHGRGGLKRLMLGSVTDRVLRESEVPVLTVRGRHAA